MERQKILLSMWDKRPMELDLHLKVYEEVSADMKIEIITFKMLYLYPYALISL